MQPIHAQKYFILLKSSDNDLLPHRLIELHDKFEEDLQAIYSAGSMTSTDILYVKYMFDAEKRNAEKDHPDFNTIKPFFKQPPEPDPSIPKVDWLKQKRGTEVLASGQRGVYIKREKGGRIRVRLENDTEAVFGSNEVKILEREPV
jgi:hypothetical protein